MLCFKKFTVLITLILLVTLSLFAQEMIGGKLVRTGVWEGSQVEYLDGEIAVNVDGSGLKQITTGEAKYFSPEWWSNLK